MPKRVDHEHRRQQIAAAVRRIAADRGLEGVSLSEVAAEAGISKGFVQHYFASRDDMLRFATTTLRSGLEERIATPSELGVRDLLIALLPLDEAARDDALVANAFLMRALKDPEIAGHFRTGHGQLRDAVAAMLTAARDDGEFASTVDPVAEAALLLALVSGLGDAVLLGYQSGEEAIALIDRHLSRITATP
ncbi:TetR family transcriptional regulator [Amycolatopsis sp. WAC 01375]|uniref:TetR/AcrR family transcriptional regulator n=1 Tax=unclassified Amycolatopsis TaxID=2618356 RepID=UPI000F7A79A8|nr:MULTISPECIES: TetR/AcrR family transcriptional regulator [unclassified Amycolatopsis]RSM79563.1 TetR family transcriptional regulator [Amycolatopsis sp. WAC 01375]RSN27614.1 TetR family transcriptional regulator [Amycolatopsis sp. WAC 01416]